MRRFELHRDTDISGVSGTGVVVEGVEFSDGVVALRWKSENPSTVVYEKGIEAVERIHGHNGATRLVWVDEPNEFLKKLPVDWAAQEGVVIMDPDGWRRDDKDFNEPITYDEYVERKWISTIRTRPDGPSWVQYD